MTLLDSAKALLFGAEPSAEAADPRLEGVEIPSIDPYDHAAVKRTLDDGIVHILTEELGMKEDLTVSNTHLGIMAAAVAIGLLGQFWPWGTDEGWLGVAICVVLYFGLSHALTLYQSLVEGDCIFTSIPDKAAGELTLRVRTGMAKHESRFVMLLEKPGLPRAQQPAAPKSVVAALVQPLFGEVGLASIAASGTAPPACAGGATNFVMAQHDYGRYFTKEGYLVRSLLRADLVKLLDKAAWLPAEMRARQQQAARHIQRFFVKAKAQGRLDADVPQADQ
ncbi:hypothetical protein FNF27_03390 [Cafeteria roenbergensis]|uniref:Signal peptidase complex subunit 2 n=2 Tax=Cafeteria roenbergensis TaxID=33653 RepID=A0A5A8EC48_CAFRO|nr:hypothetical protein FNF27_03390 [Cafeteria roenbergensis]